MLRPTYFLQPWFYGNRMKFRVIIDNSDYCHDMLLSPINLNFQQAVEPHAFPSRWKFKKMNVQDGFTRHLLIHLAIVRTTA
jgi:hypothetical protein